MANASRDSRTTSGSGAGGRRQGRPADPADVENPKNDEEGPVAASDKADPPANPPAEAGKAKADPPAPETTKAGSEPKQHASAYVDAAAALFGVSTAVAAGAFARADGDEFTLDEAKAIVEKHRAAPVEFAHTDDTDEGSA